MNIKKPFNPTQPYTTRKKQGKKGSVGLKKLGVGQEVV